MFNDTMGELSGRIFPQKHYSATSTNSIRKTSRWLCNTPLSPVREVEMDNNRPNILQDHSISSTDKSCSPEILQQQIADSPQTEYCPSTPSPCYSDIHSEYYPSSKSESESDSSASENEDFEENVTLHPANISTLTANHAIKNKNFCYFCESEVLNFARHIYRNHTGELDVQRILSTPAGSKKRKELLALLRKKGNFLCRSEEGKPVRKHNNTRYLPCADCLGFYSAKNLWKHRQICSENKSKGRTSQSDAQNILVKHLKIDSDLVLRVFPHMRADHVSLIAKKDKLICAYAARYIKIHREKHFVSVASRKMRELSRILISVRNRQPQIITLFEALKPQHYDLLVEATKEVAKYDSSTECYKSPTFAINIGTTLKQCCEIALMHVLKRAHGNNNIKTADAEADIKTLIQLISAHWRFDISSQAANDLNIKKWNKVTLIPLASDLKILKDHLLKTAKNAIAGLEKNNNDISCYTKLLETVFCRVILLNRKRPGELQRFLLNTYLNSNSDSQGNYEEFSEAVTENEKMLMKCFKRIVIRGKRGRGVPVLFSTDVREHIDILLLYRNNVIKKPNVYLFGNPNTSQPMLGYKIVKKYAVSSGAKQPESITCTKLRKHLATLTQLFNMTETDMEQLAAFMGHTLSVHRSSYRLPDDIYQTAKISKLLVLMEKGEAGQFKGKSLEEIEINLDQDLMADNEETIGELDDQEDAGILDDPPEIHIPLNILDIPGGSSSNLEPIPQNNPLPAKSVTLKKNTKRILVPWTEQQKNIVIDFFKKQIKDKRPPKRHECEELKAKYPEILNNKDWLKMKVFIQNKYKK